ncbi:MAG: COX15/CtaA family protein [Woeseiaceae bacterium]|nr:COX15/CtaA family protein [Woeseiaceae bacterium]
MTLTSSRHDRQVSTWLFACCALVFAMIVLGGVTRLTGSGLSMAEWRPIMGAIPPTSDAEWQRVFEIYQQTPEFIKVNSHFDVDDFKGIFWLEYLHRLLGRFLGLFFALPMAWFVVRGAIPLRQLPWYLLLLALGGLQGVIGKIMVASGQVDAPAVSHYKLTAHLGAAVLVYTLMFWTALSLRFRKRSNARHPWFARAAGVSALISVTILSGGFVAGLKAGKIFNTFPMMGDFWIPPGVLAFEPAWRNFFDNPATVQLDHRMLALVTFVVVMAFWFGLRRAALPARARRTLPWLPAAVAAQVALGILTLLYFVPTALAVAHQGVAVLMLTAALAITHALRDRAPA